MSDTRYGGLPLLSGPPPAVSDNSRGSGSCRKCSKEFNVLTNLFNRPKQCNHCGYLYCSTCADYQALMPRIPPETSGYDPKPVCGFCIEYLNITASGRAQLKNLPVSKLKQYIKAYDIKVNRAVEKDDFIDAIISARTASGSLPRQAERYYRKYSVPDRTTGGGSRGGVFGRHAPNTSQPQPARPTQPTPARQSSFARPDLDPNHPRTTPQYRPQQQQQSRTAAHPPPPRPSQPQQRHSDPSSSNRPAQTNSNVPPRASPPQARSTSTAPPPSLDELISMSPEAINALSVSTLKAILFENHVNARQILEKAELVSKVNGLVEEEKQTRERHRIAEEMEREYIRMREQERQEELEQERRRREAAEAPIPEPTTPPADEEPSVDNAKPPSPAPTTPPKVPMPSVFNDRSGLCIICQDEEATIVIVDCGHLCLCRDCSGVVMKSTRECPLCRTRIITEQRLLRVFRT